MDGILITGLSTRSLIFILIGLIFLSAFFSASETALMSVNKYRLKHLATNKNKSANLVLTLLTRPDRLLAIILIGNNFVNITASAIATLIGLNLLGEFGVVVSTLSLTVVILIFAEIAPKTLAAIKPQPISFIAVRPLQYLLWLIFPLVWLSNCFSNTLLKILGVNSIKGKLDPITLEELRTVVTEANTHIPIRHQNMLTGILNLENITVNDIMVPKTEVVGIDLDDNINTIKQKIRLTQHTLLPIFTNELNNIEGIIHTRELSRLLLDNQLAPITIRSIMKKPLFVIENTPLQTQLLHFQRNKNRLGIVVDEYGDVLGLVTLEDILEEIVGEFTTDITSHRGDVVKQKDGTFIVDGSANIRVLNRTMGWKLPTTGAKTLSGAIIEYLEIIPTPKTCVMLSNHPIEVLQVQDNMIKTCKIYPATK